MVRKAHLETAIALAFAVTLALAPMGAAVAQGRVVEIIPEPETITYDQAAANVARALPIARAKMSDSLIDYPSARFEEVSAAAAWDGKYVRFCGRINSKNRMGGYTGWQPFLMLVTDKATWLVGDVHLAHINVICAVADIRSVPILSDDLRSQ